MPGGLVARTLWVCSAEAQILSLVGELDPTCLTKSSHAATKTGHSKTDISKNKINKKYFF